MLGLFRYFVPAPLTKLLSPLADMLSWAVWFKFLPNKVIANTCLFILTSFSEQSASWKVPEICDLWALSTDSPKTYSVNKYMYTASSSYSFDWGGGGGRNGKDPISLFCCISLQNGNTTWEDVWSFPYMYSGSSSYSFDCGGGGRNGKDPISLFCCISLPKWKDYMKSCWVFSVNSSEPHWQNYYFPASWYAQLSSMVQVCA